MFAAANGAFASADKAVQREEQLFGTADFRPKFLHI
jgi:hypothetical protein